MFMAALILVLSVAALGQFALFYWRALLVSTAAEPVSDALRETADLNGREIAAADFQILLGLREICPDLGAQKEHWGGVRVYFSLLSLLKAVPGAAQWARAEQAVCSRYAAVLIDRRLRANAQLRLNLNHY